MIPWTNSPRHEIIIIMITPSPNFARSFFFLKPTQSCSVLSSSDWHVSRVRGDKMLLLQFSKRMEIKRNQEQSCFRFNMYILCSVRFMQRLTSARPENYLNRDLILVSSPCFNEKPTHCINMLPSSRSSMENKMHFQ